MSPRRWQCDESKAFIRQTKTHMLGFACRWIAQVPLLIVATYAHSAPLGGFPLKRTTWGAALHAEPRLDRAHPLRMSASFASRPSRSSLADESRVRTEMLTSRPRTDQPSRVKRLTACSATSSRETSDSWNSIRATSVRTGESAASECTLPTRVPRHSLANHIERQLGHSVKPVDV